MMTGTNIHSAFNSKGEIIHSKVAIHPGEILRDEIEASGLKKSFIAEKLGIRPNYLSDIFTGKRKITAELAFRLELVMGITADFWLRSQARYDLTLVRNKHRMLTEE